MNKKSKALSSTQIEQRFTVIRSALAVIIAILFYNNNVIIPKNPIFASLLRY